MAPDDGLLSADWVLEPQTRASSRSSYSVRISNLILTMSIGVHDHEKVTPQRVAINVELVLDYPAGGFGDALYRKVVCYETLIRRIKEMASEGHVILVETFAERVADLALTDRRVLSVAVDVEKLDIFDDCDAVGTTIEKSRL
ncbi:MAG: dihydroneopterin aldolase [Alphaproteobacteria bacterium]|jgi:dihydroneopterin aldolase|nr:dihydroneopterin aldolase [Alphaproteobacteria bacterium]